MKKDLIGTVLSVASVLALVGFANGNSTAAQPTVDDRKTPHVPADYRSKYEFLGAWAIASDTGNGSKQMHVVYASPGTTSAYRRMGVFPDGAVLVKEVFDTSTAPMTTGAAVSRVEGLKGWFVMTKDATGSHSANPLWGDGWGWSWFDAGNPSITTSKSYKADCQGCHVPASATDRVYVQGYPALRP